MPGKLEGISPSVVVQRYARDFAHLTRVTAVENLREQHVWLGIDNLEASPVAQSFRDLQVPKADYDGVPLDSQQMRRQTGNVDRVDKFHRMAMRVQARAGDDLIRTSILLDAARQLLDDRIVIPVADFVERRKNAAATEVLGQRIPAERRSGLQQLAVNFLRKVPTRKYAIRQWFLPVRRVKAAPVAYV